MLESDRWIACASRFFEADLMAMQIWFQGLMVERLQQKTRAIVGQLGQNKNDWNETCYQFLARNFGLKTNALHFELLPRALPIQILAKHKNKLFQLEALLFGTAGLLNERLLGDDYFLALRKEYSFLHKDYQLKPIESHRWKFLHLRPVNFPTVRLAQFAVLVHHSSALFSSLVESAFHNILINTVVSFFCVWRIPQPTKPERQSTGVSGKNSGRTQFHSFKLEKAWGSGALSFRQSGVDSDEEQLLHTQKMFELSFGNQTDHPR